MPFEISFGKLPPREEPSSTMFDQTQSASPKDCNSSLGGPVWNELIPRFNKHLQVPRIIPQNKVILVFSEFCISVKIISCWTVRWISVDQKLNIHSKMSPFHLTSKTGIEVT